MLNILIIDDQRIFHPGITRGLKNAFSSNEITVECKFLYATNEAEALEYVRRNNDINMIVMNYIMPGANGDQVFIKICRENPNFESIALGYSSSLHTVDEWNEKIKSKFQNMHPNERPHDLPKINYCLPKPIESNSTIVNVIIQKFIDNNRSAIFPSATYGANR